MSNAKLMSLALSLVLTAGTGLAFAQATDASTAPTKPCVAKPCDAGKKCHKHKRKGGGQIFKQLGLSEEQRESLKAKHETFRQENAALLSDMKAKFQQLRALPKTPEYQAQRDALKAEIKKDRQTLHEKHTAIMQQVLTPEQFQKYQALKQQRKEEWRKKHGQRAPKVSS